MVKKMQVMRERAALLLQVGLAMAIMVALLAVSDAPSSSPAPRQPRLHQPVDEGAARRIETLFAGIPQQGPALGDPKAPVTLQFFADLECPEARRFVIGALPFVIRKWVRGGKLRIEYHSVPAETVWPDIFNHQQVAALAAGRQGRLWEYLDFFYHEQGPEYTRYAIDHFLQARAREVRGLDFAEWMEDRHERVLSRRVKEDRRMARERGIRLTPAFLIGPTGGAPEQLLRFSLTEPSAFDEAIERVMEARALN